MAMKLLAVGDLHLGRLPARLPDSLGVPRAELSPAGAWQQVIDLALHESVAAVLLAGDVVESGDDFFEALPRLRVGIERLNQAGIRVIGISGNHDGDVLPALADQIPGFEFMGADGHWQSTAIHGPEDTLNLWGWSFPGTHCHTDPLTDFPGRQDNRPTLGLLHCDRDQVGSAYAPVTSTALRGAALDGWLLGHIHQPDPLGIDHPQGYLGTVVPLDASETGPRGPWLLTINKGRITDWRHCPLAALRWERLTVDLTGVTSVDEARARLLDALEHLSSQLTNSAYEPRVVGLRLHYTGACDLPADALPDQLGREAVSGLPGAEHIASFIDAARVDLRPNTPLETLAMREDHPGLLARRLLILERPADDSERRALIEAALAQVRSAAEGSQWRRLGTPPDDAEAVAAQLRQAGQEALRAMLNPQARVE